MGPLHPFSYAAADEVSSAAASQLQDPESLSQLCTALAGDIAMHEGPFLSSEACSARPA